MDLCSFNNDGVDPEHGEEDDVMVTLQQEWHSDTESAVVDNSISLVLGRHALSDVSADDGDVDLDNISSLTTSGRFDKTSLSAGKLFILDPNLIRLELNKFLEENWYVVLDWDGILKDRMREANKRVPSLEWGPGKMNQWPCDAVPVNEIADSTRGIRLYLGSSAAALKVDEIQDDSLSLVMSMNDQDTKTKQEPSDWVEFFAGHKLNNLRYLGWDETNINYWDDYERWAEKIVSFVIIWNSMVMDFIQSHNMFRSEHADDTFSVLVHCYGGINRSGAAILCLVMMIENLSLEQALEKSLLLNAPEKPYWTRRNYFIPALLFFQHLNVRHLEAAQAKSSS